MRAEGVSRVLLLCWMGWMVGCTSKPLPEETALASSAAPLVVEGWEGTGAMAEARKLHTGVVLPSGKVLVVGGSRGATYLSSATVYEPGTGSWTVAAPMAEGRQAHTVTVLGSGKVLVAGGEGTTGNLASTAVYDPATNAWSSAGNFASGVARAYLTATRLGSGKVLVAGGGNGGGSQKTVDVYDPVAGTWSLAANMVTQRRNHTATLLPSGQVLVVGGRESTILATAELYDPVSNKWTATGAMGGGRYNHTATLLATGQVLVVGGRNSAGLVATAELYEPSTGTWSTAGTLGTAREFHTMTLLSTGKVLVAGGQSGSALGSVELYNPSTRTWSATGALGSARYQHVAVLLEAQKKVLVVGGQNGSASLATAEVYAYDACAGVSCTSAPGACYEAVGTCSAGVCSYAPKAAGASCDDGNGCTGGDTCNGAGVCGGSAISCSSAPGQCYEAAGTCSGGACSYKYKAEGAVCDDGDACTVGEVCNGVGGCGGEPVSCTTPPGQCYEAAGTCSGGACDYAPKAAGTACNDGNASTINDVCSGAGVCAGTLACTTPPGACYGSPGTSVGGTCTYPLKAAGTSCGPGQVCDAAGTCGTGCWIAGAYYASGATNPSGDCQVCNPSASTSSWSYKPATTQCRASDGTCDVAEYCTGSTATCPTDAKQPGSTQCRAAGGACDVAEYCTGSGNACPADGYASSATTCRASAGVCDVAESCTGTGVSCPADGFQASGAACTNDGNACTSDVCNGTGTCGHPLVAAGTSCGSGQVCDAAGTCGNGCWIGGAYYAAGATNPSGDCQVCNPSASTSAWSYKPATTQCRASGGTCDVAEYCTGSTATCPADAKQPSSTQCRASGGTCDVAEYCTGTGAACPADAVVSAGTTCRASSGSCDVAEACNGSSKDCPANGYVSNGTSCGTSYGGWSGCGFGDYCTTTGTQSRSVTASTCSSGVCSATSTSTETQSCTRSPPSTSCGGTSYGGWSACSYGDACSATGTQSRTVSSSGFNCSTGQCEASSWTQTQSCSRPAPTGSCGPTSYGSWGVCERSGNYCSTSGTQWRSVTSYTCGGGTCNVNYGSQSQTCDSGGNQWCPGPSYGAWSACSFGDACTATGTQSRRVTNYDFNCSSGQCNPSTYTETQTCTRSQPALTCPAPSYGEWGGCGLPDPCGKGIEFRVLTSYSPDYASCQCVTSYSVDTRACTLPPLPSGAVCNGVCVDLNTDPSNCGGCGNLCVYTNLCRGGRCVIW